MKTLGIILIIVGILFITLPVFILFSSAVGVHYGIGRDGFGANIALFTIGCIIGSGGILILSDEVKK